MKSLKILAQHPKEFAIAIAVVIMNAVNLYQAVKSKTFTEDMIVALLVAIFSLIGLYFNIPTSEENARHTGLMRLEKIYKRSGTDGEDFFDEPDDEDGEEE